MKESLTDYIAELSGDDISILEDVIINKYAKFRKFFELLRAHTKDIKKFEYTFNEKELLTIQATFKKKVTLDDKKEMIEEWKEAGYSVKYSIKDKTMTVEIKYKE